jgi:hypothetical protein
MNRFFETIYTKEIEYEIWNVECYTMFCRKFSMKTVARELENYNLDRVAV